MVKKCWIKNGTEVTLNLSSNVVGDANDETNCTHKSSWTNRQVMKLWRAFINGLSANIKAMTLLYSKNNVIWLFEVYKTYKAIYIKKTMLYQNMECVAVNIKPYQRTTS